MSEQNTQKARTGINRIWHAGLISHQGLKAAMGEKAFKQEVMLALLMVPLSFIVGETWIETSVLLASVMLVLVAELLNSAIEAVVDLIGEWHELAGKAKDMGSAAVCLCLVTMCLIWCSFMIHKIIT